MAPASHRLRPKQNNESRSASTAASNNAAESSFPSGQRPDIDLKYVSKDNQGWRRIVRNFSPSWFSVTMGTGVVSNIFLVIPWHTTWLYYLGVVFFVLNIGLFFSALTVSVLRYTIWPEIWSVMIQDPTNSLFLGTIPMGFATLIGSFILICVPAWGTWAVWFAWGCWILDSVLAVAVTVTLGILL